MVKVYVEGGGETSALHTACREGFSKFITKSGIKNRPRIVACGSRRSAYDSFCSSIENGEPAILLVDSEEQIASKFQVGDPSEWMPWQHLKAREGDGWQKPLSATELDCHLMSQVMESWFIADTSALGYFFGKEFKSTKLPSVTRVIESIPKDEVFAALKNATRLCAPKGEYGKGSHSFKLLAMIDPIKVISASPWAKRFIDELMRKMS
jgi:hypothetical protein